MSNSEIQDIWQKIEDLKREVNAVNNHPSLKDKGGAGLNKSPESKASDSHPSSSIERKKPEFQAEKLLSYQNLRKLGATVILVTMLAGGYRAFQTKPASAKPNLDHLPPTDHITTTLDKDQPKPDPNVLRIVDLDEDSGEFKSFMDYRMVTDPTSRQYQLLQSPNIITNNQGLRCYQLDGHSYPLIAVGSGITTEVGQRLNVFIQSDQNQEYILQAIVGDLKDNDHTDSTNTYHIVDNSVIEFLVDTKQLKQDEPLAATMGDLSYINTGQFKGAVSKIEILDQIVDY